MATQKQAQGAPTAQKTAERRSLREPIERLRGLLESIDPDLAFYLERQLGLPGAPADVELTAAQRARIVAVLKDVRATLAACGSPKAFREEMTRRLTAVRQARDAVARAWLEYTRPVETGYRQLEQVFANAGVGARAIVLPIQPEDLHDRAFDTHGNVLWEDALPPKVRALRNLLQQRNNALRPHGWIGLMAVPDIGNRGFTEFRKALGEYSQKLLVSLLVSPRTTARHGDLIQNTIQALADDEQQAALGSGANPRAVHYVGDVVAREAFVGSDGAPLDQPVVLAPVHAMAGAFSRNDRAKGVFAPPASIKPGAGGDLAVARMTQEFTEDQVKAAHNAAPQALNVVFYHPQQKRAFAMGAFVSGGQGLNSIGAQRVKDKVQVLVRKLLLENLGIENTNPAERKKAIENAVRKILNRQYKGRALQDGGKVTATPEGTGWRVNIAIKPSTVDTAFEFAVEVDEREAAESE